MGKAKSQSRPREGASTDFCLVLKARLKALDSQSETNSEKGMGERCVPKAEG